MKNNQILMAVALVLAVVVAMLVYDRSREPQTPMEALSGAVKTMKSDLKEAQEEIKDEIDDATTGN